jgi:hypothetical protein
VQEPTEIEQIQALMPAGVTWLPGHGFRLGGPGDRVLRPRRGTARPGWMWPEAWRILSPVRRSELEIEWEPIKLGIEAEEARMRREGVPMPDPPAAAAVSDSDAEDDGDVAALPTVPCMFQHREKLPDPALPFDTAVARSGSAKRVGTVARRWMLGRIQGLRVG